MKTKDFLDHMNSRRRGKMSELELQAAEFAFVAHDGQTRKFNFEPYICHPAEVASIVAQVSNDPETLAAAWLHDVVEDCSVTIEAIKKLFGESVAEYVMFLTNPSQINPELKKLNRAARKIADMQQLAKAPKQAKTVKLADILSNINSLVYNDPSFARVWIKEKAELMPHLAEGEVELYMLVRNNIANSKEYLRI